MPSNHVRPYFKIAPRDHAHASGSGPWAVPDLCAAYQWPRSLIGGGTLAIIELGGGYTMDDVKMFCQIAGVAVPSIVDVSVDGTTNTPGGDADVEVALDIQIAIAGYSLATGGKPAAVRMYWAADIAPAIRKATADGCDVCSISWGADEANWGKIAADDLDAAASAALAAGMVIFAASGDNDSSDGGPSAANVDLPAASPHIIGCGGTNKTRSAETVWNNNPGNASGEGSGGGYSTMFPVPSYQSGKIPSGPGRMVPDVAANADPNTGYQIVYGGQVIVVGGTSAVAPLYAGLFAAFGRKLGAGIHAKLWGGAGAFADITQGDNGMFHAAVGPDPCTGLGAPIAAKIDALFAGAQPTPAPTPGSPWPTLQQVTAWAESHIPNAFMTGAQARKYIAAGLAANYKPPT